MRTDAGVFDVSHMGQIETRGPEATGVSAATCSPTTSGACPRAGPSTASSAASDGGVLDDLFTYRLADCHFLTVTNAANHERDLAWFRAQASELRRRRRSTARTTFAMLAVQGPRARRLARRPRRRRAAAADALLRAHGGRSPDAGVRHRLHRRGRRRAAAGPRAAPGTCGTRCSRPGRRRSGLGARDTLRLEVCFHLYGNDLSEQRGPIEAGLGWCCREATGFIGADAVARGARRRGPSETPGGVRDRGLGHRPPGQSDRRRRRGHQRHLLAVPGAGDRDGLRARRPRRARRRGSRSTSAAPPRTAVVVPKPIYQQGGS